MHFSEFDTTEILFQLLVVFYSFSSFSCLYLSLLLMLVLLFFFFILLADIRWYASECLWVWSRFSVFISNDFYLPKKCTKHLLCCKSSSCLPKKKSDKKLSMFGRLNKAVCFQLSVKNGYWQFEAVQNRRRTIFN